MFDCADVDCPQEAKFTASDGAVGDRFGESVAISDDTVLVGAPSDDQGVPLDEGGAIINSGSTYVFDLVADTLLLDSLDAAHQHDRTGVIDELTDRVLAPVIEQARRLWQAAGFDTEVVTQISVGIVNLPGALLGLAYPDRILIDSDAGGIGWSLDTATTDGSSTHAVDLLSVVTHELGHILGLPDTDDDHAVMGRRLGVGTSRIPNGDEVEYFAHARALDGGIDLDALARRAALDTRFDATPITPGSLALGPEVSPLRPQRSDPNEDRAQLGISALSLGSELQQSSIVTLDDDAMLARRHGQDDQVESDGLFELLALDLLQP